VITGTLFFVPAADFLDDLPDLPGGGAAEAAAAPDVTARPTIPWDRRPEGENRPMNNLHRELAPISEAAWAGPCSLPRVTDEHLRHNSRTVRRMHQLLNVFVL
jgi:hypothetical protein